MNFLKSKKGVEALPLRYIIIALVAALVVGIVLQFTGTLGSGIKSNAETINSSVTERTVCELDNNRPIISSATADCDNKDMIISAVINDECGIDSAWAYVKTTSGTSLSDITLKKTGGSETNSIWGAEYEDDTEYPANVNVYIYAKDSSTSGNIIDTQSRAYELTVTCT